MIDWALLEDTPKRWRREFSAASPFPYLQLDYLLSPKPLLELLESWPDDAAPWKSSQRGKRSMTLDSGGIPAAGLSVLRELNGERFVNCLRAITDIADLRSDPTLGGGGLHETLGGGVLPLHVDFNRQNIEGTLYYRRLNVLLFLNETWKTEWQGLLELAASPKQKPEQRVKIVPLFNRMVIAESSDRSWHGHPHVLRCPAGVTRKSIAAYYYSATPHASYRKDHSTDYRIDRANMRREKKLYKRERAK